jgi:phospholipase D1/2
VALENAKETIYIEDWWLSPELFLRRPPYYNQEWRLDQILKRRAEAGVKIFVIVYREVEAALTCNSIHTKHALQALCPEGSLGHGNITVMRHPDHNVLENAADMTFYWAHHEKFIVIDYNVAFIGGLDLCFGRWDSHQHPLSDIHPVGVAEEIWPGQDFNNNRVMDFKDVNDWQGNQLSKAEYGRMPWHDSAMGVIGDCVYDIAEHFVLRWNFIKRDKYKRDDTFCWLTLAGKEGPDEALVGIQRPKHPVGGYTHHPLSPLESKALGSQGTVHAQIVRSSADWSSGILVEHSIMNANCEVIRKAEHYVYIENQFFITATGDQQAPIRNTIGRAIVDAVVRAAKEGRRFRVICVIPCVPGFAGDLRSDSALGTRAIMDYQYKSICRGEHSIFEQIRKEGVNPEQYVYFFNLRSFDRLNVNEKIKKQEEKSGVSYQEVQRAEAQEIMGEGVQGTADDEGGVDKHMGAWKHPNLHPLQGDKHRPVTQNDDSGNENKEQAIDAKRKYEAARDGALEQDPLSSDSVAGNAMVNSGTLSDTAWDGNEQEEVRLWIQEELYIHGKLLIADDKTVICGSSNINDRSQLGYHDSELSIVMTDSKVLQSTMDGKPYDAGYHAATLRRYLWREHLGLLPAQELDASKDANAQPPHVPNNPQEDETYELVADPLSDDVWKMWTSNATTNTRIFRQLFHADPDNYGMVYLPLPPSLPLFSPPSPS